MNKIRFFLFSTLFFNFTLQAAEGKTVLCCIDRLLKKLAENQSKGLDKNPNNIISNSFKEKICPDSQVVPITTALNSPDEYGQIPVVLQWIKDQKCKLICFNQKEEVLYDSFTIIFNKEGVVSCGWNREISESELHSFLKNRLPQIVQERIDNLYTVNTDTLRNFKHSENSRFKPLKPPVKK